jgi:hypothetical protein
MMARMQTEERDLTRWWRRWIVLNSVLCALGSTAFVAILVLRADAIFFAISEPLFVAPHPPHPMSADTRMANCIAFGLFAGWSVSIAWSYAAMPAAAIRTVSRALLAGLAVWFVLDSGGCILSGAPWNAAANSVYLVAMTIPLVALLRAKAASSAS